MDRETAEFVIYIINEVANLTGKSTARVYQVLSETGCVESYLAPFYDVLHTLSSETVVEDVLDYISQRGKQL